MTRTKVTRQHRSATLPRRRWEQSRNASLTREGTAQNSFFAVLLPVKTVHVRARTDYLRYSREGARTTALVATHLITREPDTQWPESGLCPVPVTFREPPIVRIAVGL